MNNIDIHSLRSLFTAIYAMFGYVSRTYRPFPSTSLHYLFELCANIVVLIAIIAIDVSYVDYMLMLLLRAFVRAKVC